MNWSFYKKLLWNLNFGSGFNIFLEVMLDVVVGTKVGEIDDEIVPHKADM